MPDLIFPSLLILPLLVCVIRGAVYLFYIKRYRNKIKIERPYRASMLFGLSTIYTFNEHYFYTDDKDDMVFEPVPSSKDEIKDAYCRNESRRKILPSASFEREVLLDAEGMVSTKKNCNQIS